MKREKTEKTWILPLFILAVLAFNLVLVSAATAFEESAFFKFIAPYFVPEGMEGISGLIIGFISLLILFVIFIDIFGLIPIFSVVTTRYISIGLAIIMVVLKWNVTAAGWIFSVGSSLFGFAGTLAVFATIIFAILVLVALFIGGSFLQKITGKMQDIQTNRENLEKMRKASGAGGDIAALAKEAREATKNN